MKKEMYICHKCGRTFEADELVPVYQWDGEGVMGGYHAVEDKCPYCGSTDDWAEAEECSCCGNYFDKDDMVESDDYWYCKDCAGRVHDAYWAKFGG